MNGMTDELDYVNRDPNNLNDHVKVCFDEIIGEPEGAHSFKCVYRCSFCCFTFCKSCLYHFLTIVYGIPLAMFWGCEFAWITFVHVWYVTPYLRAFMIHCGCIQKFYGTCLQCCMQPCFEAMGHCLNNIKVTNVTG